MMTQPVRSSIFVEASKKIYKFFDIHICVCIPHFFLIVPKYIRTMWLLIVKKILFLEAKKSSQLLEST